MLFFSARMAAQPEVCPLVDAEMTPTCIEACIICDIDGYTGTHSSDVNGELPDDFCTFFVHNAQWIAFQAGSEDLMIELTVSDCEIGVGLEMAIYQSLDCENFEMVSNCLGGMGGIVGEGESGIFENTVPLVIGQYYYLAMDGGMGDNCDWTLDVLEGSTELAPLDSVGEISGSDSLCINTSETYSVVPALGATAYKWYIDDVLIDSLANTSIDYAFTESGIFTICVAASNVCSTSPASCTEVMVGEESTTTLQDTICQGEIYNFEGTELTNSGVYPVLLTSLLGCDSTVVLDLLVLPISIDTTYFTLCEGDTIFTDMQTISQSGTFIDTFAIAEGCDSLAYYIIDLALPVVEMISIELCEGDTISTQQHTITTAGLYTDSLVTLQNCDSIVILDVSLLETKVDTITIINCQDDAFVLDGVAYEQDTSFSISLLTNMGCDSIVNYEVTFIETTRDTLSIELCSGEEVMVNTLLLTMAGEYVDTLINTQGCDSVLTIYVTEQSCTIDWTVWVEDIDCFRDSTGIIYVQAQSGVLPILCSLESTDDQIVRLDSIMTYADTLIFDGLPSGMYNILLTDQNGNEETRTINIVEQAQLSASATVSDYNGYSVSCHGYNDAFISLSIDGGSPPYEVSWSSGAIDTILADLFAGTYEVLITDSLNCTQALTYQLIEPDSLTLDLQISESSCDVSATLQLVDIDGGVPPYTQIVNGDVLKDDSVTPIMEPGQYTFLLQDDNNCSLSDEFSLSEAVECDINIPNVFSPNGDGTNDFFGIFVSGDFSGSFQSLKIYDRWGNLVFTLDDFMPNENLWDGTFNNIPVEQGVFAYIMEYTVEALGQRVISGDVTVIR